MSNDCLFCKIVNGNIPAEKVFENDNVIGFKDLYPQAKTHLLFIHKSHHSNIVDMMDSNVEGVTQILAGISEYAKSSGLVDDGFRILTNIGESAGQSVFHCHFHVLSDDRLGKFGKQ